MGQTMGKVYFTPGAELLFVCQNAVLKGDRNALWPLSLRSGCLDISNIIA